MRRAFGRLMVRLGPLRRRAWRLTRGGHGLMFHCDFVRLKDSVFTEWRSELREASRVIWYERWRTNRLNRNGQPAPAPSKPYKYGGRMGPIRDGRRTR